MSQSTYSLPWVRYVFGNVFFSRNIGPFFNKYEVRVPYPKTTCRQTLTNCVNLIGLWYFPCFNGWKDFLSEGNEFVISQMSWTLNNEGLLINLCGLISVVHYTFPVLSKHKSHLNICQVFGAKVSHYCFQWKWVKSLSLF